MLPNLGRLLPVARKAGVQVVHCTAYRRADGKGANTQRPPVRRRAEVAGRRCCPARPTVEVLAELGPGAGGPRAHPHARPQPDGRHRPRRGAAQPRRPTIVATGVSVNIAITNLVMDAVNLGYDVVLPRDAVAGIPQEYADAVIDNTLALLATVITTDDLIAAWTLSAGRAAGDGGAGRPRVGLHPGARPVGGGALRRQGRR